MNPLAAGRAVAFLGAFLAFSLELAAAKALLPRFGGSAYVWTTSVMFFQALLLVAYGACHAALGGGRAARYDRWHYGVLLLPLLFFPLRPSWAVLGAGPLADLLWTLARSVGVPFVVLSMTVPFAQSRLARSAAKEEGAYFLYAASNLGAMAGLLAYPLLIEPLLPLKAQSWAWCALYAAYAALHLALPRGERDRSREAITGFDETLTARRRWLWVLLAAAPCAAMLATSNFLTLDFAAVPLLWTAPLAVYLATFVLNFKRKPWYPGGMNSALLPLLGAWVVLCLGLAMLAVSRSADSTPVQTLRRLMDIGKFGYVTAALFVVGMICHRSLSTARPSSERAMSEYYGWIAAGGLLGSLAVGVLVPWLGRGVALLGLDWGVAGLTAAAALAVRDWDGLSGFARRRPRLSAAFAAAFALLLVLFAAGRRAAEAESGVVYSLRNFYGVYSVVDKDGVRALFHGNTDHGVQSLDPDKKLLPLSYYNLHSPLGEAFDALGAGWKRVAVVGLGAGGIAAYGRAGQSMDFYELDPDVAAIAGRWFTYLASTPARTRVILGDARLSLEAESGASYDLVILDAFNSGAVPIHLLTKEAVTSYLARVPADGVILLHVSNRYLDLRPMLASLAGDLGLAGASKRLTQNGRIAEDRVPSSWAALSRDASKIDALIREKGWSDLKASPRGRAWTDDHASLLSVLAF